MHVILAGKLDNSARSTISEIFVDGFYQWLKYFSKDKQKLSRAFAHMYNLDVFYVAKLDGNIAGIAALNDGTSPTVKLDKKEMQKHLGFFRGWFAYKMLGHEFMDKQYPFDMIPGMGYVEFVATAPSYRGKGAATAIIEHFFSLPHFNEYVLEVADTNENAVHLYEKLGFHEFKRMEMKNKKQSGVNFLVYMKAQCK
ncbi:MAG TPA: N-acetyltransferase [Ruminococcaceae bacterium]|jgi:ribosomal protein S18 acetylase RimI-like enzyme|uniref:Acetyltransferase (GNAT) family protein n=1 Tax=Muricomes intestini TaxID=1796634 RepID=A0A4R3KGD3_9FIRM|nr:GNAT family N-acetyltransferase [Muricomes intestini]TCS82290.1 acetyltransferase (GNAT) family protein [Muricomes intestini]HBI74485.1 N-acetyltransferase [Lachnospiraceae bacterium]HBT65171.1 N-acetyltransferase [Oscillospiraceae bacterium]HCR84697.1 N-acetyltransferase [Lachnospiraceae bacterium]